MPDLTPDQIAGEVIELYRVGSPGAMDAGWPLLLAREVLALAKRTEQAEKERDDYREREPALDALLQAVTARVKTSRCLRRPDSKLESDPGDCGQCTVCRERDALARYRLWNERVRTCEQHTQDIAAPTPPFRDGQCFAGGCHESSGVTRCSGNRT